MSRRYYFLAAAVVLGAIALVLPSDAAQEVTVTGEVVDSVCFIKNGASGSGHRNCAQNCADNGIPLALLEEGTNELIWLASDEMMQSPNADLRPHASHKVRITGEYAERAGAKILVISSIEHISQ